MASANQKVEITDVGTLENASVTLRGSKGALSVEILDANGNQVTALGTSYDEGDVDTTFTGFMMMWEDTGNTAAVINAGNPLPVDIGSGTITIDSEFPAAATITDNFANPTTTSVMSMLMGWDGSAWDRLHATAGDLHIHDGGNTITVDGTVTANAGTNLNTSALATSANQLSDGHAVTIDNVSTNEVFVRGSQAAGSPVDNEVVTIQGIASMTALSVTESSPISGFATSANQLADGHAVTVDNISTDEVFVRGSQSAGSPVDGEVVTIQGIASGTNLQVIGTIAATSDSVPDLDGTSLLGTHALLSIRSDVNTTVGVTGEDSTHNTVHTSISDGEGIANVNASNELNVAEANSTAILADTAAMDTNLAILAGWDNAASDGASVSGDTAHDAIDAGEPVKVGHKALNLNTSITAVAANDRTDWYSNRHGIPWVLGGHPRTLTASINVSDADGAQTDTALVTVGANVAIVVLLLQVYVDEDTTAGTQCRIGFGTANTPALDAAAVVLSRSGIPPGGGAVVGDGSGIVAQGASNEDLRLTSADPTGGNMDVIVTYFTIVI